jgi:hypothetical protein
MLSVDQCHGVYRRGTASHDLMAQMTAGASGRWESTCGGFLHCMGRSDTCDVIPGGDVVGGGGWRKRRKEAGLNLTPLSQMIDVHVWVLRPRGRLDL